MTLGILAAATWGNLGGKWSEGLVISTVAPTLLDLTLPPLGVIVLKLDRETTWQAMTGQLSYRRLTWTLALEMALPVPALGYQAG